MIAQKERRAGNLDTCLTFYERNWKENQVWIVLFIFPSDDTSVFGKPYLANLFESVRIRIRNIEPKAYRTDTFS